MYHKQSRSFIIPKKIVSTKNHTRSSKPQCENKSVATVQTQSLSKTKTKALALALKNRLTSSPRYPRCKLENCSVCPTILQKMPVTKCTHPGQPCTGGYFPHVSRKMLAKCHETNDFSILLTCPGFPNPLNREEPSQNVSNVMPSVSDTVSGDSSSVVARPQSEDPLRNLALMFNENIAPKREGMAKRVLQDAAILLGKRVDTTLSYLSLGGSSLKKPRMGD